MQVVSRKIDLLFKRRQDVSANQTIKLAIRQMVGKVQNDSLLIELLLGFMQDLTELRIFHRIGMGKFQLGREPLTDWKHRCPFPCKHGSEKFILCC